jgi:hypothetical protein
MDPSGHYPEPFGEALSNSSQRVAQLTSLVGAAAEVAIRLKAARAARQTAQDEQARRVLDEQERTARAQARARWAPAHDARWLAQASLLQAAGTGGAAAPWASTDPAAASAMRKSEERLRTLHPFAMAAMTGSAAKEPARSTRCAKPRRCSASTRTHVPRRPARRLRSMLQVLMPRRSPGSLTAPHASLDQNWIPTRTRSVVDGGLPSGCKPRLFTGGGQSSVLMSLPLPWNRRVACPPRSSNGS